MTVAKNSILGDYKLDNIEFVVNMKKKIWVNDVIIKINFK